MTPEEFKKDAAHILSLIQTKTRSLDQGNVIDLNALIPQITTLCTKADVMTGAERQQVNSLIAAMVSELDNLERKMNAQYHDVQQQLRDLNSNTKAISAYARASKAR